MEELRYGINLFNGDAMGTRPLKPMYDLSCSKRRMAGSFSIPDQTLPGQEPSYKAQCSGELKASDFVHSQSIDALGNHLQSSVDGFDVSDL